ncbi:MAG TPA: GYD domain-containing protein [Gemmatimonadales bacterium]|nr:GYD domain-containing protein [Gemmatimonadales bacterium]
MPSYLLRGSYTAEGAKGLAKEGGTKRRAAVQQMVEQAGGKVHAFYFALGQDDVYVIAELPDATTGMALSLVVNASGAVRLESTQLFSPEEFDAAAKKTVAYRAPGA